MKFVSKYIAHQPDEKGQIPYSKSEHHVWKQLFNRQMQIVPHRACDEFIAGLEQLDLNDKHIPQLPEVNQKLSIITGWEVVPVNALISARDFFDLLAHRRFPAATFIRTQEELDYVQEPDIFHELFGHCPMLTHPTYADFMQAYAQFVLSQPESDWALLQRLFWFTVEFGLMETSAGIRAYGGGILSSISETPYSVESHVPLRIYFDAVAAFRTPYRIDQLQKVYFVIQAFEQLYQLVKGDLAQQMNEAKALGEFPALFTIEPNNPSIHIFAC